MDTLTDFFMTEAEILTALAHPTRLEILELRREGELCVCHIQAVLDQRQAYVSQQLNTLRQAGLVSRRKDGKRVYYRVSDARIFEVTDSLKGLLRAQKKRKISIPEKVEASAPKQPCNCPRCVSTPA